MRSKVEKLTNGPRGALRRIDAAEYLGISVTQLWRLVSTGKIHPTSYGTYSIAELDRHLREEVEQAKAKFES